MRQGQQGNPTDQTTNFFWGMILIIGVAVLIWFLDKTFIVKLTFWIRGFELYAASGLAYVLNTILRWMQLPLINTKVLHFWQHYIHVENPKSVPFHALVKISAVFGYWWRIPVSAILVGLAFFLYFGSRDNRFCQTYNLKSLRAVEVKNWPQITPVTDVDLVKADINEGPWAMSILPKTYGDIHNLLHVVKVKEKTITKELWKVKRGPAHRVFVMQLGPLWRGPRHLPIHLKALLLVFLQRVEGEPGDAERFLKQVSASASNGQLDFTNVEVELKKYEKSRILPWLAKRHAYVSTLMMTLLEAARVDGVLASAEFLWLKPLDRRFWYAFNNVGRQTAFVEVAGVIAHWRAEKKIGRALQVPMVKEAVNAYELAMLDILYTPEEDSWQSKEA